MGPSPPSVSHAELLGHGKERHYRPPARKRPSTGTVPDAGTGSLGAKFGEATPMHDRIMGSLAGTTSRKSTAGLLRGGGVTKVRIPKSPPGLNNPMVSRHALGDDTSQFLMNGQWRLFTPSKGKAVARAPAQGRDLSKWNDIKFA